MKRSAIVIAIILVISSGLYAKDSSDKSYMFNIGLSIPSTPAEFSDYWVAGMNFGIGLNIPVNRRVSIQGNFAYTNFGLNKEKLMGDTGVSGSGIQIQGGSASILSAYLDLKSTVFGGSKSVVPYLLVGTGFFRLSFEDIIMSYYGQYRGIEGSSESKFGLELGAGMDFPINRGAYFFMDLKYVIGFTEVENTTYFPLRFGIGF